MKLLETKNIIILSMIFALIALTMMYPLEYKDHFRTVLGAVLGYYFGITQNEEKKVDK